MTTTFGDYRSARERRDWAYAWLAANALEGDERDVAIRDWWRCADLESVARVAVWGDPMGERGTGQDALWWMDEPRWQMTLGGVVIATHEALDLNPLAVKWARVPAEAVAHLHREWALEHDPDNAGVTQEVFDALDSGDGEWIKRAARAARAAESRAAVEWAWAAARAAARAADAAAVAAEAVDAWAAARAAEAAARAGKPTRKEWAHRWTVYVLQHIKEASR